MNINELDAKALIEPLKGVELTRWFAATADLKHFLRMLLSERALVCLSPNRTERCDDPATGVFWQARQNGTRAAMLISRPGRSGQAIRASVVDAMPRWNALRSGSQWQCQGQTGEV